MVAGRRGLYYINFMSVYMRYISNIKLAIRKQIKGLYNYIIFILDIYFFEMFTL